MIEYFKNIFVIAFIVGCIVLKIIGETSKWNK